MQSRLARTFSRLRSSGVFRRRKRISVRRSRALLFQPLERRDLLVAAALDLSFSGDGLSLVDFSGAQDFAYDAALQPDGKLVVVGSSGPDMAIVRYLPDGSLDKTFSSDGKLIVSVGSGEDIAHAVLIQADGKIVAAGTASSPSNANHDFAAIRLHPNGTLDTSFSGDGLVRFNATGFSFHDWGFAAALQPDGKILIGGQHQTSSSGAVNLAIVRLNSDGTFDTTFGGDGAAAAPPQAVYAMSLTPAGKVVGAGYEASSYTVVRFDTNGVLDGALGGGNGYVNRPFVTGTTENRAEGLYVQPDGKMLLAGSYLQSGIRKLALTRLLSNGSVDGSFGTGGVVTTTIGSGGADEIHDLEVQADGKLVVAGSTKIGSKQKFLVVRYLPDGTLDPDFTTEGYGTVSFGTHDDEAQAAVLQPDGHIVLVGSSFDGGDHNFAVARILPQTPNQPPVAHAGGPYSFPEGSWRTLDGSASTDERLASLIYEWDLDYDGQSFTSDAVGVSPSVSFPDNFATRTIALRVTDSDGLSSLATTTLSVTNVNPILFASGLEQVDYDGLFTLHLESRDPGDDAVSSWRVNWGDGNIETVYGDPLHVTHAYPSLTKTYQISVTGTDDDGITSAPGLAVSVRPLNPPSPVVDPEFAGGVGWRATAFGADAMAHDALWQSDGKLILVGAAGFKMALARYHPDGSLDRSFGGQGTGYVLTNVSNNQRYGDVAHGVALTADGRIVVVGSADYPTVTNRDVLVARYTADGVLDPTFGGTGTVVTKLTTRGDLGLSVAVQADQKIVVAGKTDVAGNLEFMILRYSEDGTLDPHFSGDGKLSFEFGGTDDEANSLLIQLDGKIVAAGNSAGDIAVARIRPDGILDTSFSSDGLVKIAVGGGTLDWGRKILQQPDGKLLIAGHSDLGLKGRIALARLHSNGSLDASFGSDGVVATSVTYADDFGYDVALDSLGRPVVAGFMNNGVTSEVLVARYTPGGALDPTFYGDGTYSVSLGRVSDEGRALVLGPSDEIYVAGSTDDGSLNHFLLTRFTPSTFDPSLSPVADAAGPYLVAANATTVSLDASGTQDSDDPQSALLYEWDLDYDGSAFQVNASGIHPTASINAALLPRTVALRVTDPNGRVSLETTLLARSSDIPTLSISGPDSVAEGAEYVLSLQASGSGTANITNWEVDWGDGTISSYPPGTTTAKHHYPDGPASFTIRGAAFIRTTRFEAPPPLTIQVLDVAPNLSVSSGGSADEGSPFWLQLHYQDPGLDPAIQWIIDWGDGSTTQWPGAASQAQHVYADGSAQFTIRAQVTNSDGTFLAAPSTVLVANVDPFLRISGPSTVEEGTTYPLQLSSTDLGRDTLIHWTVDWGDGSLETFQGAPESVHHVYTSVGAFVLKATATDEDGTFAAPPLEIFVGDIPPTAWISGASTALEGESYQLRLDAVNPGPDTIHAWRIAWGDGTVSEVPGNPSTTVHTYLDGHASHTIRAWVIDDDGTYAAESEMEITVNDVPPTLRITGLPAVDEGTEYLLQLSASDLGQDAITHWRIQWGDGSESELAGGATWATHTFPDGPAEHSIVAYATNEDGTFASPTLDIQVLDRAPEIGFSGPTQVSEGTWYELRLSSTDWGDDPLDYWQVDWGDGQSERIAGDSTVAYHFYADGPREVEIRGAAYQESQEYPAPTLNVTVTNVPPMVDIRGPLMIDEGDLYPLTLDWSDVGSDQLKAWSIDWGDGTQEVIAGDVREVSHRFADGPADHTIRATAVDEDGSYLTNKLTVHVRDVAPELKPSGPAEVDEGSNYRLLLGVKDFGEDQLSEWRITWGDGSEVTVPGDQPFIDHRYADGPIAYAIRIEARDEDGIYQAGPLSVEVRNVPPVLRISGAETTEEGAIYELHLASMDPGDDAIQQWHIDWGDGTSSEHVGNPQLATHAYADGPDTFEIQATARDEDGSFVSNRHHVSILNQMPRVRIHGETETHEAETYQLNLQVHDAGDDHVDRWWIDWGDGTTELVEGNPSSLLHRYTDGPETFILRATAYDEDGEYPAEHALTVFVHNVAPEIHLEAPAEVDEGTSYTIDFSITDLGLDTVDHWTIQWGDGFEETLPGSASSATHVYRDGDGQYALTLSATDEDGTWTIRKPDLKVRDVAPEIILTGPHLVDEGSRLLLHLDVVDPGEDEAQLWIVDWGDGRIEELTGDAMAAAHTYLDGSSGFAIRVTVKNDDGLFTSEPWPVAVANVAPRLRLEGPAIIDEGDNYVLLLSASDPGVDTITQWTIDWGDGHYESLGGLATTASHGFRDGENTYEVRAWATDEDGIWPAVASVTVRVLDTPPTITLAGEDAVAEGSDYTLTVDAVDAGEDTITGWTIRWGDGTEEIVDGNPRTFVHTYLDGHAEYLVEVIATDEDGDHPATVPARVNVWNVSPRFDSVEGPTGTVEVDQEFGVTGLFSDAGILDQHLVTVDWGDGSQLELASVVESRGSGGFATRHVYLDEGLYEVRLIVSDGDGFDVHIMPVEVISVIPILTELSATEATEGGTVTLRGSYEGVRLTRPYALTVEWGDGGTDTVAVSGGFFEVSHQYLDDAPSAASQDRIPIGMTLTDGGRGTVRETTFTTIHNVAPVITTWSSTAPLCGSAVERGVVTMEAVFEDVGILDTHTVSIDWGDGAQSSPTVVQSSGGGRVQSRHSYSSGGVFTITLTVVDDDGGKTTQTATAFVAGVGVVGSTLYVVGTEESDHVTINQAGKKYKVHADFLNSGAFREFPTDGIYRIVVLACGGDDHVTISGSIALPTRLDGGSGDDHLNGGAGSNLLLGGPGIDQLIGGKHRDLMIGGLGADRLIGNGGDDILIGGTTAYDEQDAALLMLLAEWQSQRTASQRRSNLSRGTAGGDGSTFASRANGTHFLEEGGLLPTVFDDRAVDQLTGGSGEDWYFEPM